MVDGALDRAVAGSDHGAMDAENIATLVAQLDLVPHPEGGFYRELYRAPLVLPQAALPSSFAGDRAAATAIHFLLTADSFSAFHRIAADELWFFHAGDPLDVVVLGDEPQRYRLGPLGSDGAPFAVVAGGRTFGARVAPGGAWSLVSCVVAPGFDFADFELPSRAALTAAYPAQAELIAALTR